jgi:putative nucleotidyltransferase with HDIG domain
MDAPGSNLVIVRALMSVIDACDPFTRGHSFRISKYVMRMARELGVPEAEWEQIEFGALLHDIGRTAILHDVLLRPGKLELRERAVLRTHPTIGFEIVRDLPALDRAAEIVYAHHERPDGTGYPRGLRGEQIPMGARLIMVASAFDAMTEDRPYRKGLSVEEAYAELRRHSGTQFFPDVVDVFVELHQTGALYSGFTQEEIEIYAKPRPLVET